MSSNHSRSYSSVNKELAGLGLSRGWEDGSVSTLFQASGSLLAMTGTPCFIESLLSVSYGLSSASKLSYFLFVLMKPVKLNWTPSLSLWQNTVIKGTYHRENWSILAHSSWGIQSTMAEKTEGEDLEGVAIGTGSWLVTLYSHSAHRVRTGNVVKP